MRAATEAITYDRSLEKYKGSSPGAMPGARLRLAYALIPVFLALAATFNTLNNGFAFDDEWMILRNPFVHSLRNLPLVLTTNPWTSTEESSVSAFPYFRPVLAGLLVVSYRIFGATAWGYHLVNILIHVGVTLLVFIVVKEITGRLAGAAVCSALFAVHPVHAEAVAWISGVPEPLMAIFALPSFWFYLNYRKTGRKLSIAASAVFFLLALMSKETALALPLIVAYCELAWPGDSAPLKKRILQSLALAGLYAMPAAAYFGLRYYVNGSLFLTYEPHFGWQHTLLSMPLAAIKYLALLLLPAGYKIHHYTEPVESIESIAFIGPLLVIIAVALAVRFARVRAISLSAAWLSLWMALPLAAIGAFLPVYFVQERYLYIASMGFCLAVAIGIERLAGRGRAGRVASAVICALLLIVWAGASLKQNRVWKDNITLFEHNLSADPGSPQARASLALEYFFQRRPAEAEREARAAVELDPNCLDGYIASGYMAENSGAIDQAIEHLERAVSTVSERPANRSVLASIHARLGWLYAKRKEELRAEESFRRAAGMVDDPQILFEMGQFYFEQGRYNEARELFEQTARQVSPRIASVHLRLGRVYDRLGQPDRARHEFMMYLDLSPKGKARKEVMARLSQL